MTQEAKVRLLLIFGTILILTSLTLVVFAIRRRSELRTDVNQSVTANLAAMTQEPRQATLGIPVGLQVPADMARRADYSAVFEDGLFLVLYRIEDSRCRPGTTCVWAGELAPILTLEGGGVGASRRELAMGQTTRPEIRVGGYRIQLLEVSETDAVFMVDKE